jgi:hypothetical protein
MIQISPGFRTGFAWPTLMIVKPAIGYAHEPLTPITEPVRLASTTGLSTRIRSDHKHTQLRTGSAEREFAYQSSSGQKGVGFHGANGTIAKTTNAVYAGHDGNIYKKNPDGGWSQYVKGGGWNTVDTSAAKQQIQQTSQNVERSRTGNTGSQSLGSASRAARSVPREAIPSGTLQGLDTSAQARQRGQAQTERFQNFRRSGGGGRFGGLRGRR